MSIRIIITQFLNTTRDNSVTEHKQLHNAALSETTFYTLAIVSTIKGVGTKAPFNGDFAFG